MAHTLGPWSGVGFDDGQRFIAGGDGQPVAKILERERGEFEANTRLIASAPDLLAVLRALLGAILEGPGALPGTVPEWHQWEPIIQARAAIERNS